MKNIVFLIAMLISQSVPAQILTQLKHNWDSGMNVLKQSMHPQKNKTPQNNMQQPAQNNAVPQANINQSNNAAPNLQAVANDYIHIIPMPADVRYLGKPPVIFNNKLYYPLNRENGTQLAEINTNDVKFISNPDAITTDPNHGYNGLPLVYNGKLYFCYAHNNNLDLAAFDGDKILIIPSFDLHYYFNQWYSPVISDNKLYLQYWNRNMEKPTLAVFDGTELKAADIYSDKQGSSPMVAYKNKIYYTKEIRGYGTYDFNGTKTEDVPYNSHIGIACTIYNNKLMAVTANTAFKTGFPVLNWLEWDGTTGNQIPMPNDSLSVSDIFNTVIYNNKFYFFMYPPLALKDESLSATNTSAIYTMYQIGSLDYYIGEYDGNKIKMFSNPLKGTYTSRFVSCNNKIYVLITEAAHDLVKQTTHLVELDGNALKLIPNPGNSSLDPQSLIAYNNKVFVIYDYKLAVYDGNALTVVPTAYQAALGNSAIVFDNKLFFNVDTGIGYYDGTTP